MPAAVAVAAVGAYSANRQASAAKKAAQAQKGSTDKSIRFQEKALAQQRADLRPFRGLATNKIMREYRDVADNTIDTSGMVNFANYNPDTDPILNNALNRTARAVMEAQAAKGKLGSGETQNALIESMAPMMMQRQGQMAGFREQQFNEAYNAQNQRYNQLAGITGLAQNAAAMQGNATQSATNNITNLATQGANAVAAGKIGAANARADMVNNIIGLGAYGYDKGWFN